MNNLEKAKEIIKEYYEYADCGIFNSRNTVGDMMKTIYKDNGLTIDVCYDYSYYEVFGLSDAEFEELKKYHYSLNKDDEIELVIKIPKETYQGVVSTNKMQGRWENDLLGTLCAGVANGTPLPKGHDRLIYAKDVGEYLTLADVPTIIEADKTKRIWWRSYQRRML